MSGERILGLPLEAFNGSNNAGYNGKYNLQLPVGVTYREIVLKLENLSISQITLVSLTLNGDEIMRVSGEELDLLRESTGVHKTPNRLILPFTDTTQSTIESQNLTELVTFMGENLVLRIETGAPTAAQTAAGSVGSIVGRAKFAGQRAMRTHIPRIYSDGMNGTRAGEVKYSGLATQNKSGNPTRVQRLFVMTDKCSNLELMRDRRSIWDMSLDDNNFDLKSNGENPPDGVFMYSAVQEGWAGVDALGVVGNFEFVTTLDEAGDFNVLYQAVEVLISPVGA